MTQPRIKFTVDDYLTTPPGKRYQLLDGEMILAPAPTDKHQAIVGGFLVALHQFVTRNKLGQVRVSPYDVALSNYDVAQPDVLLVSNERAHIITAANIQGAPDLVIEVLSPSTERHDRGYKRVLYGRSSAREYWLVDPETETAEVLVESSPGLVNHATFNRPDTLTSPLLPELGVSLEQIFSA